MRDCGDFDHLETRPGALRVELVAVSRCHSAAGLYIEWRLNMPVNP